MILVWLGVLIGITAIALFSGNSLHPRNAEAGGFLPEEDMLLYVSGLESGWQDWSWATHTLVDSSQKLGSNPSLSFQPTQYKGVFLHHDSFSTVGYKALVFWIQGGKQGGQKIGVCAVDANKRFGPKVEVSAYLVGKTIPSGKFGLCYIPLEKLQAANTTISGICFQDISGESQVSVYLADIRLAATNTKKTPAGPIALSVNTAQPLGAINPNIYGMASSTPEMIRQLHLTLWRWGGNPNTRYNWEKGNCWNAARDWYFRNGNGSSNAPADRQPSGVADRAIANGKSAGADALITIPTVGWVARDDNNGNEGVNVPKQGGPPVAPGSEAIAGYDPTENRNRVSIRSVARKGKPFSDPPDLKDEVVYQDEWVSHLVSKFGKAASGGVKFYAMDNEPDLWDTTHTDIHPVRPDYEELLRQFLTYAEAVKDVDPSAQIAGPTSWGWTGYFFSPRDRGEDSYATHADRKAHGDMAFLPWFLQSVAAHDKKTGRRTLDVLDVHYYPQANGVYRGGSDPALNALRLRSTRCLWDPSYSDESWIGTQVQLLPRLRQWVNKYYPGTKIAINEWNWGADISINGALAVAEVLGIFGRERADMACYWTMPGLGTPGFYAYKMYRNADGAGHGFGDKAVSATSSDPNRVSCFGSVDSATGQPIVMLINKMPTETANVTLTLSGGKPLTRASVLRYSSENLKAIVSVPGVAVQGGLVRLGLPAYSITLLRCR